MQFPISIGQTGSMEMRDSNSDEKETIETATQALAWNDGPVTTDYGEGPLPTARATPSATLALPRQRTK